MNDQNDRESGSNTKTDIYWMPFKIAKSKSLMSMLEVILVLVLAYLAATSFWLFFAPSEIRSPFANGLANTKQTPIDQSTNNLNVLSAFDPFNRTNTAVIGNQPATLAPETSLDLKLLGIRQNLADENTGSTIIRLPNSKERVFIISQEIIDGVSLREIYTTHITISRAGSIETLYLEGVDPDQVQQQIIDANKPVQTIATAQTIERSIPLETLTGLTTDLKLSPNEAPKGLKVLNQNSITLLNMMGFIADDIVTSVNGNPTATNDALYRALVTANPNQPLKLTVIRDAKPIDFVITITR